MLTDLSPDKIAALDAAGELDHILPKLRPLAVEVEQLVHDPANARKHPEKNIEGIKGSLARFGQQKPLVYIGEGVVMAGNGALQSVRALGWKYVAAVPSQLSGADATAYAIADNALGLSSEWDEDRLSSLVKSLQEEDFALEVLGFDEDELSSILDGRAADLDELAKPKMASEEAKQTLAQRFGVPPFSVLDARQGYWQERKNAWLSLGLRSFEGRGQHLTYNDAGAKPPAFYDLRNEMRAASGIDPSWDEVNAEATRRGMMSAALEGTSIFDPVLCELCYRWFCPSGGIILDPFAGGSVRGLVAAMLERAYVGIDLRPEQCEANRANWEQFQLKTPSGLAPVWMEGDSRDVLADEGAHPEPYDFVFSCPPYADLEVYSDDPRDLSTMGYAAFVEAYRQIIFASVARLKADRFACFVVGDVRDPKGMYRGFVPDTIRAFEDAGARFYNDAVLVTQVASAAVRAGRTFEAGRKLCKSHQNVLVFVKGDPKRATEAIGSCEWGELGSDENTAPEDESGEEQSEERPTE